MSQCEPHGSNHHDERCSCPACLPPEPDFSIGDVVIVVNENHETYARTGTVVKLFENGVYARFPEGTYFFYSSEIDVKNE